MIVDLAKVLKRWENPVFVFRHFSSRFSAIEFFESLFFLLRLFFALTAQTVQRVIGCLNAGGFLCFVVFCSVFPVFVVCCSSKIYKLKIVREITGVGGFVFWYGFVGGLVWVIGRVSWRVFFTIL